MIVTDKDAWMCDLAETYHIFNHRELPCKTVALFSCGLRENSRIKRKLSGEKADTEEILLSIIADRIGTLVWFNSEDGAKRINRPRSVLASLVGEEEEKEVQAFDSGEDFEVAWSEITGERR